MIIFTDTAPKQASTSGNCFHELPVTKTGQYEHRRSSTQDENCFLNLSWHLTNCKRASQDFHTEWYNNFLDISCHLNKLHRTSTMVKTALWILSGTYTGSQDFYSGENCFYNHSWHLNTPTRASHAVYSDKNCFLELPRHLNRSLRASQDFKSGENSFLDLSHLLNCPTPASQALHNNRNWFLEHPRH